MILNTGQPNHGCEKGKDLAKMDIHFQASSRNKLSQQMR